MSVRLRVRYNLIFTLLAAVLMPSVTFPSCVPGEDEAANPPIPLEQALPAFSAAEIRRIDELRSAGGIRALTSQKDGIYLEAADGSTSGYHYFLLEQFARWLDTPFSIDINPRFSAYFERGGELPQEVLEGKTQGYVPDAIGRYDLYAVNLTLLPWREAILDLVPIYPTRVLLLSRTGEGIDEIADLTGKTVLTRSSTSYERILLELGEREGIDFDLEYTERTFPELLREGIGDAAAVDSEIAIISIRNRGDLRISTPLSDVQLIGWAFARGDVILSGLFRRFVSSAYENGVLDQLWYREFRISFAEYCDLIDYDLPGDLFR
jgi:membrane-bound lytic murein transglycosylase MltF